MSETKKLIFSGDLNVPNLVVRENLIVKGQSITENSEAVLTKGAVTVINSENNALRATLMGTVIRTGDDKDYAILYDPSQQAVRLGVGTFNDTDNTFQFDDEEGYPIAVRDLSSEDDGYLISWDATNYCLVKSPIKQGTGTGSIQTGLNTLALGDYSSAEGKETQAVVDYAHSEGLRKTNTDPRVTSGLRGFSIISTDYSDLTKCKVVLDSVEGIKKDYYFVYSTLEEAGSGLARRLAWRPGAIPVKVTSVDTSTKTVTIESPLQYSASNKDITGNLEFSGGKADTGRFSITQKRLFILIDYTERLASKIYFWEHPELGTSSVSQGTHAEGLSTFALGQVAHSEGRTTLAIGDYAHTEGRESIVLVENGHAEGSNTLVSATSTYASNGHAEGEKTTARGSAAHAEGVSSNSARKIYFDSETSWSTDGYNELRNSKPADILTKWTDNNKGFLMANGAGAHAEGQNTLANATGAHAEGSKTLAGADTAHAEGYLTQATGTYSHAEGSNTTATKSNAHAEGQNTTASGAASHAEGYNTAAAASCTHTEGSQTSAVGSNSHAEGMSGKPLRDVVSNTTSETEIEAKWEEDYPSSYGGSTFGVAFGKNSHVEGRNTFAKGQSSHAEGSETKAGGLAAHSEGLKAKAEGYASHAEGVFTTASGRASHVEGEKSVASGERAHAEGNGTIARGVNQHVQGRYNIEDTDNKYAHIVGGGTSDSDSGRRNIHTIDWYGNAEFAGSVKAQGNAEFGGSIKGSILYAGEATLTSQSIKLNTASGLSGSDIVDEIVGNKFANRRSTNTLEEVLGKTYASLINGWRSSSDHLKIYDLWIASGETPQTRVVYQGDGGMSALGRRGIALSGTHTEGCENIATADAGSHAEGYQTAAIGLSSHAQGNRTLASGQASFAGGTNTTASNQASFAIGISAVASGQAATALGKSTEASGNFAYAEGNKTKATGEASHAEGTGTIASSTNQHVQGRYNVEDSAGNYAHIVGGGSSSQRKNIHTIDWSGNAVFAGDVAAPRIQIGSTKLDESTLQTIIGSTTSSSGQTFFETVDCVGSYAIPADALPYIKIEKLHSNNISYSSGRKIKLAEYHDISHYTGGDLKLDVEPQEDNSVKIHIYGDLGGLWSFFTYVPYEHKRYWGHYSGNFTTTLEVVELASLPWKDDDYNGLYIDLRSRVSTNNLLSEHINRVSPKSYQVTNAQIPYVTISLGDYSSLEDYSQNYIDVTLKMSCVPTTDYYYTANLDKLSDSSIADGTSIDNFNDLRENFGSNYYSSGNNGSIAQELDYDDYFIPGTGEFVIDGMVSSAVNSQGYPIDEKYVYIQVTPGQTMKAYYTKWVNSLGTYRIYHDPALKWTMTIQRKVN